MIELLDVISRLEHGGGTLILAGDRVRYSIPKDNLEAQGFVAELRKHRSEVARLLRKRTPIPAMPPGIRLIMWKLTEGPVAIETCAVVTDPNSFARASLEQLRTALAHPQRWVGWSVTQLIDRLAQVGVIVEVDSKAAPASGQRSDIEC